MAADAGVVRRCSTCRAVFGVDERYCPRDGGAIVLDADAGDPLVGRTIGGRYFIRRPIGKGGMGVVYEADHIGLDKRVAIKLILEKYAADREALMRFHREARNASKIGHENIVDVTDIGDTEDGRSFIAMEFLDGSDLARVLSEGGAMSPARAVGIIRQVLAGLEAAHSAGILHRDMKPENVFLTQRSGVGDFVKIMDFGISKFIAARDANLRLTDTGTVVGTPIYMAPEQAMGSSSVDHRVDLYSVGVMLYELLSGRPPFNATSYLGLVSMHVNEPPPPLRSVAPGVPVTLAATVHKALEKNPDQRFADAEDFRRALPSAADLGSDSQPVAGSSGSRSSRVAPTVVSGDAARAPRRRADSLSTTAFRRSRSAWLAGATVLLAASAGTWWAMQPSGPGTSPGSRATASASAEAVPASEADPGAAQVVAPTAEAVAPPSRLGILEIDSVPAGADVFIDDELRGTTPLRLDRLAIGDHRVRLENRGFELIEASKRVRADYVESFYVVLARRGSGRRSRVESKGGDASPRARPDPVDADGAVDLAPAVKAGEPRKTDTRRRDPDDRKPNPYVVGEAATSLP